METACALWSVVLAPQFPLITEVTEFINVGCRARTLSFADTSRTPQTTGTYKGVNKDLWSMVRARLLLLRQRYAYDNATYRCLSSAGTPNPICQTLKLMGLVASVASESSPLNRCCTSQAWPSIIDDFVRWKNARADNSPAEGANCDS